MAQQTAVEWLAIYIKEITSLNCDDIIKQAKEMEKQHIMDAHNQGYADGYRDNGNSPIDYYNETYKNK